MPSLPDLRRLSDLTSVQLSVLDPETTVFVICTGALEDHGVHLPLGSHVLKAQALLLALCRALQARESPYRVIEVPAFFAGIQTNTSDVAFPIRAHVLRDYLVDVFGGLRKKGFRHFVCIAGNPAPKDLVAIEEASRILSRQSMAQFWKMPWRHPMALLSLQSRFVSWRTVLKHPTSPDFESHGGAHETSILLATSPAHVSEVYKSLPSMTHVDGFAKGWRLAWRRLSGQLRGYWGEAPAQARAEFGVAWLEQAIRVALPDLEAVWMGRPTAYSRFRSGYAWIPSNSSFFYVWVVVISTLTLAGLAWWGWS